MKHVKLEIFSTFREALEYLDSSQFMRELHVLEDEGYQFYDDFSIEIVHYKTTLDYQVCVNAIKRGYR